MVVLDAVHQIQEESAPDLRGALELQSGKMRIFSAEINGRPR